MNKKAPVGIVFRAKMEKLKASSPHFIVKILSISDEVCFPGCVDKFHFVSTLSNYTTASIQLLGTRNPTRVRMLN